MTWFLWYLWIGFIVMLWDRIQVGVSQQWSEYIIVFLVWPVVVIMYLLFGILGSIDEKEKLTDSRGEESIE